MVVELVVPDLHERVGFVMGLDAVLQEQKVDRAFFVGDFSAVINKPMVDQFKHVIAEVPKFKGLDKRQLEEQAYLSEAHQRLQPLDAAIGQLAEKHKIPVYGVLGNHDNRTTPSVMRSVDLINISRSLVNEGIIGVVRQNNDSLEVNNKWAGTKELRLPQDDANDLAKSPCYNAYKSTDIQLVVAHKSGMYGELSRHDSAPMGKGLAELAKEKKGFVEYCGHFHGEDAWGRGWIYRDKATNVLSLNPGINHAFVVTRNGKNVTNIKIYEVKQDAA